MSLLDVLKDPAARVSRGPEGAPGIIDIEDPAEVVLPLEYPGQILFTPLVKAGDEVARNQVVGRSERGNCVHATISGTIKEIRTIWTARSYHVPALVIERSDRPALTPDEALAQCGLHPSRAAAAERLQAGGVISPWTTPGRDHREADMAEYPEIKHVVIKGLNEEPTVFVFERLLQENVAALREGLDRLRDNVPRATFWLTVRRPLQAWAEAEFGDALNVVGLSDTYRHRLQRLVVPRITGVPVPHDDAFRSHGVAVMSTEHALAALAALQGQPVTHKTVTIAGGPVKQPVTVRVPLGTTVGDVIRSQGADESSYARLVSGGPMKGNALLSDEVPLSKFQHGIYLVPADELPSEINLTCVNCGRCTRACPAGIQVHLMGRYVEYDQLAEAVKFHPEACIACGLCTFVCPSHRPLVQLVRIASRYGSQES